MNVLILGDGHVYGYGLPVGQLSYVGYFIRQIRRTRRAVSVEAYAHLTMPQMLLLLKQLPLNHYDLILLQTGHDWLPQANLFRMGREGVVIDQPRSINYPTAPLLTPRTCLANDGLQANFLNRLKTAGKLTLLTGATALMPGKVPEAFSSLLTVLRPYRHSVLLMTPFPQQDPVTKWLRKQGRALLLREGNKQLFSVFDADRVVQPRDEYFLPNDDEHLNAVGHELLGQALFDFYQSAPTIATVQPARRN